MDLETVIDDLGPATQEPCPICGSTNYFPEGGFYYCSQCNTQSQVSRLYVDENFQLELQQTRTRAAVLRGEKRRRQDTVQESRRQISTWEIWNVILKTMADRLIEIGFPEVIRAKIFHIYVSFMTKRKVIFVSSSNPHAKSTITFEEPKTNLYALYGIKKPPRIKVVKRKQLLKRKKINDGDSSTLDNIEDDLYSSKRKKSTSKRKAIEKEYLTKEKDAPEVDEHEFENLIQEENQRKSVGFVEQTAKTGIRPVYSKPTAKLIEIKKSMGFSIKPRLQIKKKGRKDQIGFARRKLNNFAKLERYSINTCLITVFVALRELGFPVVMTDILRLHLVGILHFDNILKLINQVKDYQDVQTIPSFFSSYHFTTIQNFGYDIINFVKYVDITKFRYPQMKEIVPKYIDEFVLPREFECLVNLINHMFSFDDYVDDLSSTVNNIEQYRALPELIVIAQFVIVLKMLYGLDDKTEKFQSEFAKLVNKVLKEETDKRDWSMEEWTELFVIEDWFAYLQRRKELVKRELCSSTMYTPNQPPSISKLDDLLRNCTLADDSDKANPTPQENAAKSCKTLFEGILEDILSNTEGSPDIPKLKPYIPLPLPTESIVHQYKERYPLVADHSIKPKLLDVNFAQKRLDFIWNPKKYVKLLKVCGYTVKVIHGDAVNNFPIDSETEMEDSKTVVVFQPYKSFDEFVGNYRDECSCTMKLILDICEDLIPGVNPEKAESSYAGPFLQKLVNAIGDMYIKRVLTELIPIMTRWNDPDAD